MSFSKVDYDALESVMRHEYFLSNKDSLGLNFYLQQLKKKKHPLQRSVELELAVLQIAAKLEQEIQEQLDVYGLHRYKYFLSNKPLATFIQIGNGSAMQRHTT